MIQNKTIFLFALYLEQPASFQPISTQENLFTDWWQSDELIKTVKNSYTLFES
jgi:hypothetical protein